MSTNVPIASITLSAATPSVTFSGIPQTYTDLVLVCSGSTISTGAPIWLSVNGITSNYSWTRLYGNGTTTSSDRAASSQSDIPASTGNFTDCTSILHFNNYANTTTFKQVLLRANTSSAYVGANVGSTNSTSAITSITIRTQSQSISAGSTFNLYGINAENSAQAKATGGTTIIRDSNYWYHVFTGSGTFTPTQAITADVLVVAGGGGGGGGFNVSAAMGGGGGGAGGLLAYTSQSLLAQSYTVTIGAGGSAGTYSNQGGSNSGSSGGIGSNSQFGSLSAASGGGGGAGRFTAPSNGGSGGGGASDNGFTVGTGIAGQGNDGGLAYGSGTSRAGAGGGGRGAVGARPSGSTGGSGGAGSNTYSSWATATSTGVSGFYAGGGAGGGGSAGSGGTGGSGGGGNGGNSGATGSAALANTGGGGGGGQGAESSSGTSGNGGAGGSGIIIVRYPV